MFCARGTDGHRHSWARGDRLCGVSPVLSSEVLLGTVIQFGRPASAEVIANLVKLGYLQPAKRYEANALEAAVARLRHDLRRDGVICEGDPPQTGIAQQRS